MTPRTCPSCQSRLSPLAVECVTCGLRVSGGRAPRPLLFQASALASRTALDTVPAGKPVLTAPALGRVAPVVAPEAEPIRLEDLPLPLPPPAPALPGSGSSPLSLGPLFLLEGGEALLLAALNLALALLASALLDAPLARLYSAGWMLLLPVHLALSWGFLVAPLLLAGQSPLMARLNLVLAEEAPEKRLAYSLLHLLSLALLPVSALCLILGHRHQTLGELLSGQEILPRAVARMRG